MLDFVGENDVRSRYPVNELREIHLTYTLVDGKAMKSLLLSSPNVETLSVEWGDSDVGGCDFMYDDIGEAIRTCNQSGSLKNLKSLTLDEQHCQNESREVLDGGEFPPLGDLRSLSALQVLEVSQAALVGVDLSLDADTDESAYRMPSLLEILPGSLVRLKVNSSESEGLPDFDERLLELATSDQFHCLAEITVVRAPTFSKQQELEAAGWRLSKRTINFSERVNMTFYKAESEKAGIL